MLVAILGLCLASWVVADSISNEDIQFLSHWTRLSVDALKKYESVVGKLSFFFKGHFNRRTSMVERRGFIPCFTFSVLLSIIRTSFV
jgi:hypothetical protein